MGMNSVASQYHKTRLCPFYLTGNCHKGSRCSYAHGSEEMKPMPDLHKTKMCEAFQRGQCQDENCRFAHGRHELRCTTQFFKTRLCHFWEKGDCNRGNLCRHAHGYRELSCKVNGEEVRSLENPIRAKQIPKVFPGLVTRPADVVSEAGQDETRASEGREGSSSSSASSSRFLTPKKTNWAMLELPTDTLPSDEDWEDASYGLAIRRLSEMLETSQMFDLGPLSDNEVSFISVRRSVQNEGAFNDLTRFLEQESYGPELPPLGNYNPFDYSNSESYGTESHGNSESYSTESYDNSGSAVRNFPSYPINTTTWSHHAALDLKDAMRNTTLGGSPALSAFESTVASERASMRSISSYPNFFAHNYPAEEHEELHPILEDFVDHLAGAI